MSLITCHIHILHFGLRSLSRSKTTTLEYLLSVLHLFHTLMTWSLAIKVKCYMYIKLNKDLSGLYKFYTNKWQGPALGARL